MGKYSGTLLVSDFDRTITAPDGTIPEANLSAVRRFMEEGGRFCVATGRTLPLFRNKIGLFPFNAPMILFNGAMAYDFNTESVVFDHPMPKDVVKFCLDIQRRFPKMYYELLLAGRHAVHSCDEPRRRLLVEHDVTMCTLDDILPDEPVYMGSIIGRYVSPADTGEDYFACTDEEEQTIRAILAHIAERGKGQYSGVRPAKLLIEYMADGISKGAAARELVVKLGCSRLACIGDAMNDLSMLEEADVAFMPSDGDEELLQRPEFRHCAPCSEGAVASAISML